MSGSSAAVSVELVSMMMIECRVLALRENAVLLKESKSTPVVSLLRQQQAEPDSLNLDWPLWLMAPFETVWAGILPPAIERIRPAVRRSD